MVRASDQTSKVHAYSLNHPRKLAELLQDASCTERTRLTSQRDVWGSTPLHIAASHKNSTQAASVLLRYGADADAIGPYGVTPRATALMVGNDAVGELLKKHGGTLRVGPFNEPTRRSVLANIFGVTGTTVYNGQILDLSSSMVHGMYPVLANSLLAFSRDAIGKNLLPLPLAKQWAKALFAAPTRSPGDPGAVGLLVDETAPQVLCSGWLGHSVCVALWQGYVVVANRLFRAPNSATSKTWMVLRLPNGSPGRALVSGLLGCASRSAPRGMWHIISLEFSRYAAAKTDPLRRALKAHRLKAQGPGNCTVASAKAAIFALLMVAELTAQLPHGVKARDVYKHWTTFLRVQTLRDYMTFHQGIDQRDTSDDALMENCARQLRKPSRHVWLPETWQPLELPASTVGG